MPIGLRHLGIAFFGLLAAGVAHPQVAPTNTARLVGVIRDDRGVPVAGARATFSAVGGEIASNDSGQFVFDSLPPGQGKLTVRTLGFEPISREVLVVTDSAVSVDVAFVTRVVILGTVSIRERRYQANLAEFERRRRMGFGHYITPEELARRAPNRLALVVSHLPGTQLTCPRVGSECVILMRRVGGVAGSGVATSGMCSPAVYLDGKLDRTGVAWTLYSDQIGAIEVYPRETTRPAEFSPLNNRCGAIAVWTRLDYFEHTADAVASRRCNGRLNWCYMRQWWPMAVLVSAGVVVAVALR